MIAMVELPYTLTDSVLPGDGIGKTMKIPTLNISTAWIDRTLRHGIYAGAVILSDGSEYLTAIHYGPRPALRNSSIRLEAHLLDITLKETPTEATVMFVSFLRDIEDFPDTKALQKAIQEDIKKTRAIMKPHASAS